MDKVNSNKRVCAILIDFLIITVVSFLFSLVKININRGIFSLAIFVFYIFRDSYQGQGPGKMFVGLKVVDLNGGPASLAASFKRNIILFWASFIYTFIPASAIEDVASPAFKASGIIVIASLLVYIVEYFIATRSKEGRRMGDIIGGTKVIDLNPEKAGSTYAVIGFVAFVLLVALPYLSVVLTKGSGIK